MKTQIDELNESVSKVIESANKIMEEHYKEVHRKAPIIIRNQLNRLLVETMEVNPGKAPIEVPEAMEVITAMNVLDKLHPES